MSGVAVAAGRDLGGVKWINRAYSNDDRAWRLSEARYAGDLSEPALIQDLDPKSLPDGWNAIPHGQASARWGGNWCDLGSSSAWFCHPWWCTKPGTFCSIRCIQP